MCDETYHGYPNRETWALHLWLSNEQATAEEAQRVVTAAYASVDGAGNAGRVAAADVARTVTGSDISECLLAIFLDARNRVTGYSEIARGTLNASRFTPRDVLVPTLHANAAAVIVAHNHPSRDASPSRADRTATASLREAARMIGVSLVDHLIVTTDAVFSFREAEGWGD